MARPSAAALSTLTPVLDRRPKPPAELNEKQAETWMAAVSTKPPEWWDAASFPVLIAYCEAVEALGIIAALSDGFDPAWLSTDDGLKRYNLLCSMRDRESKLIAMLAVKMRLTQQSRYEASKASVAARKAVGSRPWDLAKAVG